MNALTHHHIATMSVRSTVAFALSACVICLPALALAQTIGYVLGLINTFLNALIGILITLAIVVFFWGLVLYLVKMGTEDAHKGIHLMIWGIAAIFVMVSIWGIIQLLQTTFHVGGARAIVPQGVPYGGVY